EESEDSDSDGEPAELDDDTVTQLENALNGGDVENGSVQSSDSDDAEDGSDSSGDEAQAESGDEESTLDDESDSDADAQADADESDDSEEESKYQEQLDKPQLRPDEIRRMAGLGVQIHFCHDPEIEGYEPEELTMGLRRETVYYYRKAKKMYHGSAPALDNFDEQEVTKWYSHLEKLLDYTTKMATRYHQVDPYDPENHVDDEVVEEVYARLESFPDVQNLLDFPEGADELEHGFYSHRLESDPLRDADEEEALDIVESILGVRIPELLEEQWYCYAFRGAMYYASSATKGDDLTPEQEQMLELQEETFGLLTRLLEKYWEVDPRNKENYAGEGQMWEFGSFLMKEYPELCDRLFPDWVIWPFGKGLPELDMAQDDEVRERDVREAVSLLFDVEAPELLFEGIRPAAAFWKYIQGGINRREDALELFEDDDEESLSEAHVNALEEEISRLETWKHTSEFVARNYYGVDGLWDKVGGVGEVTQDRVQTVMRRDFGWVFGLAGLPEDLVERVDEKFFD
ncbi:MAG: hypothetical protein ABEJ24_02145, partial [Candidatus Magasanikbacteria bacterium]